MDKGADMSDWISVEDRMPEFDSVTLVSFVNVLGDDTYTTASYVNLKYCAHHNKRTPTWYVHISSGHVLKTVTHWQPLPEPPNEAQS